MITMSFKKPLFSLTCFFFLTSAIHRYEAVSGHGGSSMVVRKSERQILVSTEFGQISAVNVNDGSGGGQYHLQFITLEPNALFLPVILHADMVFYVHTGSGSLSWLEVEADNTNNLDLERGDVHGLPAGSIFYLQSSLEPERQKLRIYAMFVNSNEPAFQEEPLLPMGTYSSIRDLLLGFDKKVLQGAFQVSAEAIEELVSSERQPPIVHAVVSKREEQDKKKKKKKKKTGGNQIESRFMEAVMGSRSYRMLFNFDEEILNKKGKGKKKTSTFNFMNADPDFQNCNGWSLAVTSKNLQALRSPDVGLFMVNLTRGSMMGPHWNPMAMELGIVTHGQGMVLTVSSHGGIKSDRVRVEEGDVFFVPRFHMMAQLAFNNDSFVFMGFSTTSKMNHPQYVAGKASVLQVLDRKVLAMSFNVTNSTMDQILNPAVESIILECGSCAEEEERIMNEEIQKEEAKKREEEEAAARKREEEEAKKREEEEAAARKREEEEAKKREEEEEAAARKKEEEEEAARKREEEEEMRKREEEEEEEARKRKEEEEAKKREEEEEEMRRREEEEEEARKRKEEEEAKKREEEEEMRKREEEEEEARKRKEEEEAARRREEEEEEEAKREEEEARKREKEQEEAERRKEEEEARKREEEEEAKREEEEARKREKEQEEAETRKEEEAEAEAKREEEEKAKREEEEAEAEEARKREEEEEEAIRRTEEEEEARKREEKEEEAIRTEEEEEARKREEKQQHEEEEEEWKGEGETA